MNENELLIKNRLREATVILERANLIICDESWKCDSSRPPFSSFQLVMQGEGTVQVDQTVLHPHAGQLYLLPACTHQSFFTDVQNPYRTYFCHFEITCQQTDLFQLVQFPLCVDAKDPQKAQRIFQDMIQSCKQTDISSALKAKQAVFHLLCYYFECCPPGSVSFIPQSFDHNFSPLFRFFDELDRFLFPLFLLHAACLEYFSVSCFLLFILLLFHILPFLPSFSANIF